MCTPRGLPAGTRQVDKLRTGILFSGTEVEIADGTSLTYGKVSYVVYLKASRNLFHKFRGIVERHQKRGAAVDCVPMDNSLTAFELVGSPDTVHAILAHDAIADFHATFSTVAPRGGIGMGEHKVRPAPPSNFGKPETVKATSDALQADRTRRRMQELREEHAARVAAGLPVDAE